jgi:hypothetical protein
VIFGRALRDQIHLRRMPVEDRADHEVPPPHSNASSASSAPRGPTVPRHHPIEADENDRRQAPRLPNGSRCDLAGRAVLGAKWSFGEMPMSAKCARSGHAFLLADAEQEALGQRDCRITSLALVQVWALSP